MSLNPEEHAQKPLAPSMQMLQLLNSFRIASALYTVAELGIADLLQTPRNMGDLAQETGANEDALYRLLRALASVGVFREASPRCFAQTPLSATLLSQQPGSQRDMVLMLLAPWQRKSWERLTDSVRTGEAAFPQVYGTDLWTYFAEGDPAAGRQFDQALTGAYNTSNQAIVQSYDFSSTRTVVDIGGGQGTLLTAILCQYPHLQGILFDRPAVVIEAHQQLAHAMQERITLCGGNFFESIPQGHDVYMLRQVLHDWGNDDCLRILERCRQAMASNAHLLIIERVLSPTSPPTDYFLDIQHQVLLGGRERTHEEFAALCTQARLQIKRVIATPSPFYLLEACASS